MKILLLSMPDSFEHTPALAMRFPNGALASLAGNVDPHHTVSIADLILAQRSVVETVTRLVTELQPDVVGLSVMTFQRKTARKVIALVRALRAVGDHRGRRLRPEPRAGGVRRRRVGRGRDRARRGRHHVQGTAARARGRRRRQNTMAGLSYRTAHGSSATRRAP